MVAILPGGMPAAFRLLLALLAAWLLAQPAAAAQRDPDAHFFQGFLGDLRSELDGARKEGKKGVVLVYEMEECPFCERFHRTVASQSEVQDYYRRHFVILRMDIRGSATIAGFDGAEIKESDFAVKSRVRGLPKDGAEFILLGRYVAEGHYRAGTFADFKRKPPR
jgi:thioredoxin-related protein